VPEVLTGVRRELLQDWLVGLTTVPEGFTLNPKLVRLLLAKREMAWRPLDWATAEALAWASLLSAGYRVRLSGQDSQRGTFSQRHAVLHDAKTGQTYTPLRRLFPQTPLDIINSPLSEAGVLGFEYGYSLGYPDGLVMWEAQFGDFNNSAQAIIDQFIAGAEDKWQRLSGLVLLLPHGFEGQGPEHSSARLERFLTLAANDNLQIANPTTPAQYFHLLRRQVLRAWRKPLVVMTPKSLLRHPQAQSSLDELTQGRFLRLLPDTETDPSAVRRILFCSGKIYYELAAEREKLSRRDVAILRLEQLYPLYPETLQQALAPYAAGTPVTWVQEEPENMGAWRYLRATQGEELLGRYPFAGIFRLAAASPATGSASAHQLEQDEIIQAALAGEESYGH
jgi:2-oxoglutarate dehydrogenase E1 component